MTGLFSRLQKRSIGHHPYCTAVVVAAGSASRMKGIDKIMTTLGGIPVLARTLQALEQCGRIDEIVVVTRTDLCAPVNILCREFGIQKVTAVVSGGATVPNPSDAVSAQSPDGRSWPQSMTAHVPLYLKNCWSGCSSPEPKPVRRHRRCPSRTPSNEPRMASSKRRWIGVPCSPSRPRKYSRRTLSLPPSTTVSKRASPSPMTAPQRSTWASR